LADIFATDRYALISGPNGSENSHARSSMIGTTEGEMVWNTGDWKKTGEYWKDLLNEDEWYQLPRVS
jgi:hypothetical protein